MISNFPAPVLSVTADAVRDLDGGDALSGLWILFTKCKESLKDGRRLENISWRLWYREMAVAQSYRPLTPESSSSTGEDYPFYSHREKEAPSNAVLPTTDHLTASQHFPTAIKNLEPATREQPPAAHSPHPSSYNSCTLSTRSRSTTSVGQIICDMLPNHITPPPRSPTVEHAAPNPELVQPQPEVPSVRLPGNPPAMPFPKVVVVNPTPHPTPPATPHPHHPSAVAPDHVSSAHLLPPLPPPALTVPPTQSLSRLQPVHPPSPASPPHPPLPQDKTPQDSDRRFFIKQSPDQDSPELDGSGEGSSKVSEGSSKVSEGLLNSAVSTSSHSAVADRKRTGAPRAPATRKGKEPMRHLPPRPAMQRSHSHTHTARQGTAQRKAQVVHDVVAPKPRSDGVAPRSRPTFNLGSSSKNAGSAGATISALTMSKPAPPDAPKAAASTQSNEDTDDYETDTDEDSSAYEDVSEDSEDKAKEAQDTKLREAAIEAQRQRELFTKVPKRSYSNLDRSHSGLLSALLKPDPALFPPNHPYAQRTNFAMTPLQASKTSAAPPVAAQMTNITAQPTATTSNGTGGYRPKGRPQGQELEEDTDDEEDTNDGIQLSRSVAHEKLAALAGRRTSKDRGVPPQGPLQGPPQAQLKPPARNATLPQASSSRPPLPSISTAPIPLGHPYNLPAPAPPSTPRTTRRQMLSTELSESLRRNLLWERQVSKISMIGARRRGTGTGGLRPLTATTSADGVGNAGTSAKSEAEEKEERKRVALARNRSWADDYHYAGW
ncbi:hypothetical protein PLICRDRAFT_701423 [Plicaturopsis crispa FD-325 SS-3]|uniref:Unplaced genomic scaffold PLICRscaffold_15, whole genome shotgun sequence n=1 Tax=Plicaturopsis crispa FD-325 SS-3 TaxID=944288 RepID=A0A0C9SYU8_PLICR|nr:hypothetical protein PLICRDRAFT_701423 [Plicaturopsis crispa FD-325 SS-3]